MYSCFRAQAIYWVGAISAAHLSLSHDVQAAPRPLCQLDAVKLQQCLILANSSFGIDASKDSNILKFCQVRSRSCSRQISDESFDHPIHNAPPIAPIATTPVAVTTPETAQQFFLRADPLDNPFPGLTQSATAGQSLGASFGYTQNGFVQTAKGSSVVVSNSNSISINGMATYVFTPSTFIGDYLRWVPALWVSANGNWDNPTKTFGETSALKAGPKAEFLLYNQSAGGFLNYFDIAPFYQTDFYGSGRAGGATLGWNPVNPNFFLGEVRPSYKPYVVDGFLELRAEATNLDVATPGHTNLIAHNYEWLGGAARTYLFFFPTRGDASWSSYLADRVSFVGTVQSYSDVTSRTTATLYSAALQYKLTCDTKPNVTTSPDIGKKDPTKCNGGSTSLTIQYDNGMDRDTLQEKKVLSAKLNFAY